VNLHLLDLGLMKTRIQQLQCAQKHGSLPVSIETFLEKASMYFEIKCMA
jgi:hypothetical protein